MKITLQSIILISGIFIGSISTYYAQTQGIAYSHVGKGVSTAFVTDYQALGINASALGWGTGYDKKQFTMGSSEFSFGMYSDSLNAKKLRSLSKTLYGAVLAKSPSGINYQQQLDAVADYAQAGVSINLNYNWAGFAFQNEKFGGIAFNIRESYNWSSKLNQRATDIIFRGKLSSVFDSLQIKDANGMVSTIANSSTLPDSVLAQVQRGILANPILLSDILNGTRVKANWNRSYNLGYGRQILKLGEWLKLYAGVSGRFIQSMAIFDLEASGGNLEMYTSLSPSFRINYGSVANTNPSAVAAQAKGIPKVVGKGYGVDLGFSAEFWKKLRVSVAVNNIGAVEYNRNVYKIKDTLFGGFNLNGLAQANVTNSLSQLLTTGGFLTLTGQEKYKVRNAADFRFGACWNPFVEKKTIQLGFDLVAPFNEDTPGSIQNTVISVGAEVRPIKWLALSVGFIGGGIYKSNMPLGINFILGDGKYECGISSADALNFFVKNANSVSTAFGFARFRF